MEDKRICILNIIPNHLGEPLSIDPSDLHGDYDFALGTNHLKLLFRRSLSDIIYLSVEQKQCDTYLDPENNKMLFSVKCESFN